VRVHYSQNMYNLCIITIHVIDPFSGKEYLFGKKEQKI